MKRLFSIVLIFLIFCFPFRVKAAARQQEEGKPAFVKVPVIMYHSLHNRPANQWTITPEAFANDLRYLAQNGYHAVNSTDLILFVREGIPLPEKPVMLTFDDGYYNNMLYALPLLEEYDMKIVLSVIGEHIEIWSKAEGEINITGGHLTWEQITQVHNTGRVEISNHTNALHVNKNGRNGCARKKGEDLQVYCQMLMQDIGKLQQNLWEHCGITPVCFAYPFGSKCPEALEVLKEMGFGVTLSCHEGNNTITYGNPDCLFDMRRVNRTPERSIRSILQKLEQIDA